MKKTKALTVAVVVLVIINIALIATIWLRPIFAPPRNPQPDRMQRFMFERLGLDQHQQKAIAELRQDHIKLRQKQERHLQQTRTELMEVIFHTPVDSQHVSQLLARVGSTQVELDRGLIEHVQKMQKELNPEQNRELKKLFMNMMQMRHPVKEGGDRRMGRMSGSERRTKGIQKTPPDGHPDGF